MAEIWVEGGQQNFSFFTFVVKKGDYFLLASLVGKGLKKNWKLPLLGLDPGPPQKVEKNKVLYYKNQHIIASYK